MSAEEEQPVLQEKPFKVTVTLGKTTVDLVVTESDLVNDIKIAVIESKDATFLGEFGLIPQSKSEGGDWQPLQTAPLGPYADLKGVFPEATEDVAFGFDVVKVPFNATSVAQHVLRFRDTLHAPRPTTSEGVVLPPADPSAIFLGDGITVYPVVAASDTPASAYDIVARAPTATPPAGLRGIAVSPWSPPPKYRTLRGDLLYLTLSTIEGYSYQITAATDGFFVSQSSTAVFNPAQRVSGLPSTVKRERYASLAALAADLSPEFKKFISKDSAKTESSKATANGAATSEKEDKVEADQEESSLDVYTTLPIANWLPSVHAWRVPQQAHTPDALRTQLAYLLTQTTTADVLPPPRDWNDELTQCKELPSATSQERLFRERLAVRTQSEFANAALRGLELVIAGHVSPLNPSEPEAAHTFVHNAMLFTRAADVISTFTHLGGDEAARAAAGKDLAGVSLLDRCDIPRLHTMGTVVADVGGIRWTIQSLIPGLFKADGDESASFKIVYGGADPEKPDEEVRAEESFADFAEQVAKTLHLAKHTVKQADGEIKELYTSTDTHGVIAPDHRAYLVDCFRLQPVDVEFLEQIGDAGRNGASDGTTYPHRLVLLRPELIERFRASELRKYIAAKAPEAGKEEEFDIVAAAEGFSLLFNPDAFVDRPELVIYDEKDESSQNVRRASQYLRTTAVADFINETLATQIVFPDGFALTRSLHSFGINMRYLGHLVSAVQARRAEIEKEASEAEKERKAYVEVLAKLAEKELQKAEAEAKKALEAKKEAANGETKEEAKEQETQAETKEAQDSTPAPPPSKASFVEKIFLLDALTKTLVHEIAVRAAKHVVFRLMRDFPANSHIYLLTHILNCLFSSAELSESLATNLPDSIGEVVTTASLHAAIKTEALSRFGYALPEDQKMSLKQFCQRVGLQLALKKNGKSTANGAGAVNGTSKATKGSKVVKDSETPEVSTSETPTSFHPSDIANIYPIVKCAANSFRSRFADESFDAGTRALNEGSFDLGQELVSDGLQILEQVVGHVHPETASKHHQLAVVYHGLSRNINRRISMHETAEKALADDQQTAEQKEALKEYILNDVDAARQQAQQFLQTAARILRESVIISERTNGLDHPETIQQYSDLVLLELTLMNPEAAARLCAHTTGLWDSLYGSNHPSALELLVNRCTIISSIDGIETAVPLFDECLTQCRAIYGAGNNPTEARVLYMLSQAHAMKNDYQKSFECAKESASIFGDLLGTYSRDYQDAFAFERAVAGAIERQAAVTAANASQAQAPAAGAPASVAHGHNHSHSRAHTHASKAQVAEAAPAAAIKPHGQKADLSIEELINFIEGKSQNKPKKNGKKAKKN